MTPDKSVLRRSLVIRGLKGLIYPRLTIKARRRGRLSEVSPKRSNRGGERFVDGTGGGGGGGRGGRETEK